MSDIQKAIDDKYNCAVTGTSDNLTYDEFYTFTPEQLKSLLEQVAKEAYFADRSNASQTFRDWWNEQNLTFNDK